MKIKLLSALFLIVPTMAFCGISTGPSSAGSGGSATATNVIFPDIDGTVILKSVNSFHTLSWAEGSSLWVFTDTVYGTFAGNGSGLTNVTIGTITVTNNSNFPIILATNQASIVGGTIVTVPVIRAGTNDMVKIRYGTANASGSSTNAGVFILSDTSGIAPDPTQVGYMTNTVRLPASQISTTTGAFTVVAAMTLPAGVWGVSGNLFMQPTAATTYANLRACVATATGTITADGYDGASGQTSATQVNPDSISLPYRVVTLTAPSTYNLIGFCTFLGGSVAYSGSVTAVRVR